MLDPLILSGKEVSASVYDSLVLKIKNLRNKNITPGLAVILVGENPAASLNVRSAKFSPAGETLPLNNCLEPPVNLSSKLSC